jgi:hypothetical protein
MFSSASKIAKIILAIKISTNTIKTMKAINTIDKLTPYLFASVFALAMFNLFLEFAEYVGRNGL